MHTYTISGDSSLRKEYRDLIDCVTTHGRVEAPRGIKTIEVPDFVLELESAESATFLNGIGRGASQDVLAAELMQWASGTSDLRQLTAASAVFGKFSDDGHRLYGAYGPRTYNGLRRAVSVLSQDQSSRRATVSVWRSDEQVLTADLPCTVSWSFMIRDGALNMTTFMRSNDVWTGVTYDVPSMTRIQSMMARALQVELGSYTHMVQSMHIYASDLPAVDGLHAPDADVVDPPFFHRIENDRLDQAETALCRWDLMTQWCDYALAGISFNAQFAPYATRLAKLSQNQHFCPSCRYRLPQPELFCAYPR